MRAAVLIVSLAVGAAALAVPPNDDCTSATVIGTIPFTDTIDVSGATAAGSDPTFDCAGSAGTGQPSVWYTHTASAPISLQIDTFGSDYDTTLFVYGGACGAQTGPLDCNDDDYDQDNVDYSRSRVLVTLEAGETALVEVRSLDAPFGGTSLTLHVQESPVFRVTPFADSRTWRPTIAASASEFLVAWLESTPADEIRARRYDLSGTALAPSFQINTSGVDGAIPDAAGTDDGFVVVWTANADLVGRQLDANGTPIGGEFTVDSDTPYYPVVAMAPSGHFMVAWENQGGDGILGRIFDDTATPLGAAFQVNTYSAQDEYDPDVAVDGAGNFVVVWSSGTNGTGPGPDGDQLGVFGRRFDASGTALGPEFQVNTYTTGSQRYPAVTAADDGHFLVTWWDGADGDCFHCIDARRYLPTGAPAGMVVRVASEEYDTGGWTEGPPLATATDDDGNFIVAWPRVAGHLRAVRLGPDGVPLGSPFAVTRFRDSYQYHPSVAAAPGGDFVVVWDWSPYGSKYDVMGRRVTAAETTGALCTAQPREFACHESTVPEKSKLSVRDRSPDAGDGVTWKLARGDAATLAELGDPVATHAYSLCLYDATGLVFQEIVRPGGTCATNPCWTDLGPDGFRYVDKQATQGPARKLILRPGAAGESRVVAKLKGDALTLPALPLTLPARVQLQATNGKCWDVEYTAATLNTAADFKAVGSP